MRFRRVGILTLLLVIFATIAMPIVAHAEPIYIESLDITVNTKDEPTKTVVVDKRGVLTEAEIRQIESAGERLGIYNLGIYIEMTDPNTSTQRYATELAEEKYMEMLPEENSIMIAYSFYEDENAYYGVHYNVQGDLSEGEISGIIRGTYHDFKTDGSWIAGNTDQIVDYLLKVENDLLTTDARKAAEKERNAEILRLARIVLEVLGVCCIIVLAISHKRKVDELEEIIDEKDSRIRKEKDNYSELKYEKDSVDGERKTLETWKERAIAADPDIEKKIKTLLAKRKAEKFSKDFGAAATLKDYVAMFEQYGSMTEEEKSYVTLDMGRAHDMLDDLAKIEAKKATEMIEETCQLSTTSSHYSDYSRTMNYYNGLPDCVRVLLAVSLINSLKNNHNRSHTAYTQHQESMSYSSHHHSSSYSHHSSFGGGFHSGSFGGHVGGGH